MPFKLSVITVSYNAEQSIAETFLSVRNQANKDFEYIVVDGGSNDNTCELIKQNEDIIGQWITEPDQGIADAMNKGAALAQGDYLLFLHADDRFAEGNSSNRAIESTNANTDIVAFEILFKSGQSLRKSQFRGFNFYANFKIPFYHPGVLCKRDFFNALGGFDPQFKIAMDYDFLLRAHREKASSLYVREVLTIFQDTGISSKRDQISLSKRLDEEKKLHYKNCHSQALFVLYRIWWFIYPLYRKLKSTESA